jgi:sulfite exporter TauE/SafE
MMSDASLVTLYGSLLLAGLAGSLHCVGMCGPILLAFSQVFRPPGEQGGGSLALQRDFLFYHAGRIWTYGMLGFLAGLLGKSLRQGAALVGWQKPVSILIGVSVVVVGVLLLGVVRGTRTEAVLNGCGIKRLRESRWFKSLLHGRGLAARLLLGAVMGLLPCGLVYAMLVMVAALPTPLHSMLGMVVFGIGTLPSLTAVLLASGMVSRWLRNYGTRLVAVALIVTGCLMVARTVMISPGAHAHHSPASESRE